MSESMDTAGSTRTLSGTVGDICPGGRVFELYTEGLLTDPVTVYVSSPIAAEAANREVEITVLDNGTEANGSEVHATSFRYI